jgi:hypothetical protein
MKPSICIVDDETFHLCRVHAAVRPGHRQDGHPEIREDVRGHAIDRQKTTNATAITIVKNEMGRRNANDTT